MPYNTRRKSLSLPSLGIHIPVTHAARAAAAKPTQTNRGASPVSSSTASSSSAQRQPTSVSDSSAAANMASSTTSSPKRNAPTSTSNDSSSAHHHPSKRTKRAHGGGSASSSSSSSASKSTKSSSPAGAKSSAAAATPPPSPKPLRQASVEMDAPNSDVEIDMDAVNDDIVEAVILQLQATGNRPHLIKELSAILMQELKSVQQSANPCAIISSRLATYMKRACWSTSNICPLTKELETIHPRRTYYFLTTCPHLPLPDASSAHFIVPRTSIVTPPLSSAASGSEAAEEERRRELSPSPEVDLSSPEFDDLDDDVPMPGTPGGSSFSSRYLRYSRFSRYTRPSGPSGPYFSRNHRGASPPLEKDEKEFTQTAEGLQKQKHAGNRFMLTPAAIASQSAPPSAVSNSHSNHGMDLDDAGRDESLLFGSESRHLAVVSVNAFTLMTSPTMRPTFSLGPKKDAEAESWAKLDSMVDWDRSPENIELDELDCLLDEF